MARWRSKAAMVTVVMTLIVGQEYHSRIQRFLVVVRGHDGLRYVSRHHHARKRIYAM